MTVGGPSPNTILVVEDDPLVQMLTVDIVAAAGFTVLQADNADQAVAILETRSDIAVLLTDVDMPGSMDGLKLAQAVRHRWPPIRIIVVSSRVPTRGLPADSSFLCKPYRAEAMISEIHSLLGRESQLQG